MKFTLLSPRTAWATVSCMDMPWPVSSGVVIVRAVPVFTSPLRLVAPEAKQAASMRVVFPDPPCPTTATLRICFVPKDLAWAISPPC